MPSAKRSSPRWIAGAAACVAAIGLSACGQPVKYATHGRGQVDDPRTAKANRIDCISDHHLPVRKVGVNELLIGPQPAGPKVVFLPTQGAAQGAQISGNLAYQGAEVIGGALLYPDAGSATELGTIEICLSHGVSG
jgi:hypothetical protein